MSRTIDDTIHVRTNYVQPKVGSESKLVEPGAEEIEPNQFIWRGRLYVITAVLAHWRQRQNWWAQPEALAVHGAIRHGAITSAAELTVAADRQVWRVRAAIGRSEAGTYDLCLDGAARSDQNWRLLAIDD